MRVQTEGCVVLQRSLQMFTSHRPYRLFSVGLGCAFAGAWLGELSGSLLPLALGASASLMAMGQLMLGRAKRSARRGPNRTSR